MAGDPKRELRDLFDAAVTAAVPAGTHWPVNVVPAAGGRCVVIGAGKAAAAMAWVAERRVAAPLAGLVVTPDGHGVPTRQIEVVEAAHPIPDARGEVAAQRILELARGATAEDVVLCLLSGGGSSLLAMPAEGVTLADKRELGRALLRCGASIAEMNCVRKRLSAIKGGRLALACHPASVVTVAISDVPGDDMSVIASGPTVGDDTTCADALAIVDRYGLDVPDHVRAVLTTNETPDLDHPAFRTGQLCIAASAAHALHAAAAKARDAGLTAWIHGIDVEGEAREVGAEHAELALDVASGRHAEYRPPCVLLSGGETTVTVRGDGRGGRNAEYLLALAMALDGHPRVHAIAADTDGIDGSEDNAGAVCGPDTLARARALGLSADDHLANNDAYAFFAALDDLVVTGPTRTNVNDFRAILIR